MKDLRLGHVALLAPLPAHRLSVGELGEVEARVGEEEAEPEEYRGEIRRMLPHLPATGWRLGESGRPVMCQLVGEGGHKAHGVVHGLGVIGDECASFRGTEGSGWRGRAVLHQERGCHEGVGISLLHLQLARPIGHAGVVAHAGEEGFGHGVALQAAVWEKAWGGLDQGKLRERVDAAGMPKEPAEAVELALGELGA